MFSALLNLLALAALPTAALGLGRVVVENKCGAAIEVRSQLTRGLWVATAPAGRFASSEFSAVRQEVRVRPDAGTDQFLVVDFALVDADDDRVQVLVDGNPALFDGRWAVRSSDPACRPATRRTVGDEAGVCGSDTVFTLTVCENDKSGRVAEMGDAGHASFSPRGAGWRDRKGLRVQL
ncbi:hypothetical protein UCRNP2_2094 [Neofusicoccum parvum UCRNP2]|uniref:Uncharacterized protein n=1 Tax=Botryosphaeria parva (strain UCR-NP2) TaxID=1287680 RepID=R1ETK0_BOTPV|nr:hypothetical protein UCRNP2_2094 [Neofusicoccum parvum UCRNP2]